MLFFYYLGRGGRVYGPQEGGMAAGGRDRERIPGAADCKEWSGGGDIR